MRILLWDLEVSPNVAHVWGLWDNNVSLNQLMESGDLLCFAAMWHGEPKSMKFFSEWDDGYERMVQAAWEMLNEADAVVSFNGKHFDTPWINRCFLEQGLMPPAPYKHIDLCDVVKRQFRFPSNKLAYVSEHLLGTGKVKHQGHELWVQVLAHDPKAQKTMKKYNIVDVRLLEPLYDKLIPWIPSHPSYGALEDADDVCPACGSDDLIMEGFAFTAVGKFQRWHCAQCGRWSRSSKRIGSTNITGITG